MAYLGHEIWKLFVAPHMWKKEDFYTFVENIAGTQQAEISIFIDINKYQCHGNVNYDIVCEEEEYL